MITVGLGAADTASGNIEASTTQPPQFVHLSLEIHYSHFAAIRPHRGCCKRVSITISKQFIPIDTKEILFAVVSVSCIATEYLLLEFIKPLRDENKSKNNLHVTMLYSVTKVAHVIGAIVILLILQIFFSSYYSNIILLAILLYSYVLNIGILSMFIARILTLLPHRKNMVFMMLFVLD
jgi:hypothetical protein